MYLQVSDKGNLNDTTTVILNIKDLNDNPPVITTLDQFFTVTECSSPGQQLGNFAATDLDSSFQVGFMQEVSHLDTYVVL